MGGSHARVGLRDGSGMCYQAPSDPCKGLAELAGVAGVRPLHPGRSSCTDAPSSMRAENYIHMITMFWIALLKQRLQVTGPPAMRATTSASLLTCR